MNISFAAVQGRPEAMDTEGTEAEGEEGEVVEDGAFPGTAKSSKIEAFFSIESYGDLGIPHFFRHLHIEGRSQDVKGAWLYLALSC